MSELRTGKAKVGSASSGQPSEYSFQPLAELQPRGNAFQIDDLYSDPSYCGRKGLCHQAPLPADPPTGDGWLAETIRSAELGRTALDLTGWSQEDIAETDTLGAGVDNDRDHAQEFDLDWAVEDDFALPPGYEPEPGLEPVSISESVGLLAGATSTWAADQVGLGPARDALLDEASVIARHTPYVPGSELLSADLGPMEDVFLAKGLLMGAGRALGPKGLDVKFSAPDSVFPRFDDVPPGYQVSHSGLGGLFDPHAFDRMGWPDAPGPERPSWKAAQFADGPTGDAMHPASRTRAGMARNPKHHAYPQEEREWFEERGFTEDKDIDQFTVELPRDHHDAVHGGGDWRMGRELARKKAERSAEGALRDELDVWSGEWNTTTMDRLRRAEKLEGRRLTQPEIQELVEYTMEEFSIPRDYVPYNDKSK